ncbi:MAG TPA: hypothetical protein VN864_02635 [Thermoplasmata archaeon]|nr:hypothetical protein [Thermoplasmata archaeon]
MRLHRGGRTRAWVGARFGGDYELGDRIWRRFLHGLGALAVLYLIIPSNAFVLVPTEAVLLAALELILVLELLRHFRGWELPTIRPYERDRIASYVWYAIALTVALVAFPRPVAAAVIIGTALVDPLLGELRLRFARPAGSILPGVAAYAVVAGVAFVVFGPWSGPVVVGLALLTAVVAVAVEWPTWGTVDDDLAMTIVPGAVLSAILLAWPGLV